MKPLNADDFYVANANDLQGDERPFGAMSCKPTMICIVPDCTPEDAGVYISKILEWQKEHIKLIPKVIEIEEI